MPESITISLSSEIKTALEDVTRKEGISADELIGTALKEHLFLRRFRLLRDRLVPKAQAQGILTDQDVFDRVS